MTDIHNHIAVLLLFFVVHLILGAALMTRTGRRQWLWSFMDGAAGEMSRRLNRDARSASDRIVRGAVVFVILMVCAAGAGYIWTWLATFNMGWLFDLFLLSGALGIMTPVAVMRAVGRRLGENKIDRARDIAAAHVREDLSKADAHTIARKTIEYGMEALCISLVGPALGFMLFGATGVFVYVAVMSQQRMFGQMLASQIHFGAVARAAERVVNFVPAVLTMGLIALGAVVVSRGKPVMALALPIKQAGRDDSYNRGLVLAAAAGGMGLTLGGPRRWPDGQVSKAEWLGTGHETARTDVAALKRAGMMAFVAFLVLILALSGVFMMRL